MKIYWWIVVIILFFIFMFIVGTFLIIDGNKNMKDATKYCENLGGKYVNGGNHQCLIKEEGIYYKSYKINWDYNKFGEKEFYLSH